MEKRVLIAVILSLAVLILYPYFIKWVVPPKPVEKPPVAEAPVTVAPGAPAEAPQAPQAQPVQAAEELVSVDTPFYRAVFSTLGGGVKTWELKNYRETLDTGSRPINLATTVGRIGSFRTDLTPTGGVPEIVPFTPSRKDIALKEGETAELAMAGITTYGIRVEKKYSVNSSGYTIDAEVRVTNSSKDHFSGAVVQSLLSTVAGKDEAGYHTGPVWRTRDGLNRHPEKTQREETTGKLDWAGLEDKYFLSAIIPDSKENLTWVTTVTSLNDSRVQVQFPVNLAPGAEAVYKYRTFLGPKEYDLLVGYRAGLEESIEFGVFAFLAKPLLVVLNFFERYLANYGIAIIVLTVIIKVIFYPLTKRSLKSMKDMQAMQPQLAAIKEKYKDNKEKMNKELMELYKRYNINPLGGCLPILLQIPVFIGLYEVLYAAIELRHAPLFLWIQDLSAKDPYYVTPVLMGATMFIQQKMTPTSADPTQAKIMLLMPVIFTFMFLSFPSGLVLYWLVNNVLTIGQQYLMKHHR